MSTVEDRFDTKKRNNPHYDRGHVVLDRILESSDATIHLSAEEIYDLRICATTVGWLLCMEDAIAHGGANIIGCVAVIDGKIIINKDYVPKVAPPLAIDEQLSICLDALRKIAEVDKPLAATSQSDWRRRAVLIAKKTLEDAEANHKKQQAEVKP